MPCTTAASPGRECTDTVAVWIRVMATIGATGRSAARSMKLEG